MRRMIVGFLVFVPTVFVVSVESMMSIEFPDWLGYALVAGILAGIALVGSAFYDEAFRTEQSEK